jgi:hypothetical protein
MKSSVTVVYHHLPLVGTSIFKKNKKTKLDNSIVAINARLMGTFNPLLDF